MDTISSQSESSESIKQERDVLLDVVRSTRALLNMQEKVLTLLVLGGHVEQSVIDKAREMVADGFFDKALGK